SSSDRALKISLPMCAPSNRRSGRAVSALGTRQNTTSENLVEKVRRQTHASRTYRHVCELSVFDPVLDLRIYDPDKDARRLRNRQCLSFLSFKLHPEKGLMLTAMYRNHYYIARGLGNFIGLGRLQEFIANEAGVSVGPLTCISTHAEVD